MVNTVDVNDPRGDYIVKMGLPGEKDNSESRTEINSAEVIQAAIAAAMETQNPDELADSYNKLISHIKNEGDAQFVIRPDSPKSVRENANTYLEWSNRMPQIDHQQAAFMIGSQLKFSSNTMDKENHIHGGNKNFRHDPLVIEDSHLAASAVTSFLNKYESPYFKAMVSEKQIATDTLSPHTVDLFLGRKRPPITLG